MQLERSRKRKRGGQPGNRNAAGNRGNRFARGTRGNRGGGAPRSNQNARRRRAPLEFLKRQYRHSAEAIEWLERNAEHLAADCFADDEQRDAALYAAYRGWTPEALAEQGRELELGLFTLPDESLGAQASSPARIPSESITRPAGEDACAPRKGEGGKP